MSPVQRSSCPVPHRGRASAGLRHTSAYGLASVPSAWWPRAQLAFKDSMVHEILQFTPSIAFPYVLHRCESRDIHCRESCDSCVISFLRAGVRRPGGATARAEGRDVLGASCAGCGVKSSHPLPLPPRSPLPTHAPRFSVFAAGLDNDPSVGSRTKILL
ncbi:hypothetical protein IHE45_05G074700 [Dioscorea alata]|uniref:Uncharacterized protein n=1 Tax=Dioscorea alata TaxID=55571 RepID=A0ACB7W2L6_DIOAL|nr:hypothetical protein IHE45_05G074700 [Dioscorea alata]